MEQAGCERNKGRHGRIMNNLVGEQQDLNTWVNKWVCMVCVCGAVETLVVLCTVLKAVPYSLQHTVYQYNKHSLPPFTYSLHFLHQSPCLCVCVSVSVTQSEPQCVVYYHQQPVSINRICFVPWLNLDMAIHNNNHVRNV